MQSHLNLQIFLNRMKVRERKASPLLSVLTQSVRGQPCLCTPALHWVGLWLTLINTDPWGGALVGTTAARIQELLIKAINPRGCWV